MSEEMEPFVCQVCQARVNMGTKCWCCGSEKAKEVVTRRPVPVKPLELGESVRFVRPSEDDEDRWCSELDSDRLEMESKEADRADPEDE